MIVKFTEMNSEYHQEEKVRKYSINNDIYINTEKIIHFYGMTVISKDDEKITVTCMITAKYQWVLQEVPEQIYEMISATLLYRARCKPIHSEGPYR